MRKTFLTFCVAALSLFAVSSCYDDTALWGEVEALKTKVESLENKLNEDVAAINAALAVQIKFQVNPETFEISVSYDNGTTWVATGIYAEDPNEELDEVEVLYEEGSDELTLVVNGTAYAISVYEEDASSIVLGRTDFFLRYEGSKKVELTATGVEFYVMAKPDGWKASIDGTTLTVTAPTKAAVELGAAETEGEVLVHANTPDGKCKVAKIDVSAGPGLTLKVDTDGKMTIENSYYSTSVSEDGEVSGSFSNIVAGLATPEFFYEGTVEEYVKDAYNGMSWDYIVTPNLYNFVDGGVYVEGEYETDVVVTSVADFYEVYTYSDLPLGSHFVVWVAPVDNAGNVVASETCYVEYINHVWDVELTKVTHSDVALKVNVAGADSYAIGFATPDLMGYDPVYNPITFEQYMTNPQGGPWGAFTKWGAPEALGMIVPGDQMSEFAEFNLSEIFGELLPFNSDCYVWVIPMFDFMAKYDEEQSYPEYDYYVYDYSAYKYETNCKPYVLSFKTNDIVAGGDYAATLEMTKNDYQNIYATITPSEGTESVYYAWYKKAEFDEFETDADVMAALLEDCYSPALSAKSVSATYKNPGEEWVLATFSVGTDGKYGEVVAKTFSTLAIPYKDDIKVEVVSCVEESGKFVVTVNVTGATKVAGYNVTASDANNTYFINQICINGHKANYAALQFVDVVDGKAVLTFSKNTYKKNYYITGYDVTNNVVSAVGKTPVVVDLFPAEDAE